MYFSGYAYEASAHLVQIWCRGSLHSSFNKNYVYTHVSYLHPEIILRNSNVCLHSVTSTMALFAIAKHSVDIFNFNKYVKNLDRNMIFKAQYDVNLWTKFLNSNSAHYWYLYRSCLHLIIFGDMNVPKKWIIRRKQDLYRYQ